jgi:hypothetical protein
MGVYVRCVSALEGVGLEEGLPEGGVSVSAAEKFLAQLSRFAAEWKAGSVEDGAGGRAHA